MSGSACVEIASPVKGDTSGINRDCAALNRANVISHAHQGGALRLSPLRSARG